jgi:hypothetical protein
MGARHAGADDREPMTARRQTLVYTIAAVLLLALAFSGALDAPGQRYVDDGIQRALIAFAVARSLNGVISVAQGTEVALEPGGVGVKLAPGEILDPLNDLVEQFSWIMLASSASLGVQKILLSMSLVWGFSLLIAVLLLTWLALRWWSKPTLAVFTRIAGRAALVLLVLRFSVPVMALASEGVYRLFLAEEYRQSLAALETTVERLDAMNDSATQTLQSVPDESLIDKAKRLYGNAAEMFDIKARFERYKLAAADATEQTVRLIVVFVMQTILLPLLFLWILMKVIKYVVMPARETGAVT